MKKTIAFIICIMLIFFTLGCNSPELDDAFNEDLVKEQAELVISLINEKDYDNVVELEGEDVKEALSKEVLDKVMTPIIDKCGTFKECNKITVLGHTDKNSSEPIAIAVCQCKYENSSKTYTISFNKEMQIIGFYVK